MTVPCIICDLDGTLCDISHRLGFVSGREKDWDAFHAGLINDIAVWPIAELLRILFRSGVKIVLTTGRPEKYRGATTAWLHTWDIPWSEIYMRADEDFRPDEVVKKQILDGIYVDGYDPLLVIDDREKVVRMWREEGLVCLQAAARVAEIPPTAKLSLMVGPSGAGKSSWLRSDDQLRYDIHGSHIVATDDIRQDLCGDWRDQSRNDEVFAAAHSIISARLRAGLPAVLDATNLRRKDRMAAANLAQGRCEVRYFVIDRPMDEKKRDGGWRNELPFDLIAKHDQTFRSQLKDILAGDDLPNVRVIDLRKVKNARVIMGEFFRK